MPSRGSSPDHPHPIHDDARSSSSSDDLGETLFPGSNDATADESQSDAPSAPTESVRESIITIHAAILHLIDKNYSIELASGDLKIIHLRQGNNAIAALASVAEDVRWPLAKDVTAVKLDSSHYFFSFRAPEEDDEDKGKKKEEKEGNKKEEDEVLSYGLTIASKGQEALLKQLDEILETTSNFAVLKMEGKAAEVIAEAFVTEITAGELKANEKKKEEVEGQCAAYWTTIAPNVEDYSGTAARLVAMGSGQLVKGILWCGDVTIDRLKWGDEVLKQRMAAGGNTEIDPNTLKRIERVKRVTKMTEKVATSVLSGVVKVSGFFVGSVSNSRVGKKFFNLLPGEVVLASLEGFSKLCDAVEVSGKNVMATSSTVTTDIVSHMYGEEAAKAATEGMDAAGHAVGAAWAVFKIRNAFNPKANVAMDPSSLGKSAAKSAAEMRAKGSK